LIFPCRIKGSERSKFAGRSYAHRGFHDNKEGPVENSLRAFQQAVEHDYGIELDIQLSKDGEIVVFHDDDLLRAAGIDEEVHNLNYEELKDIKIFRSDEVIPLFSDVLSLVDGKTPIIVELKAESNRALSYELCKKSFEMLRDYEGDYCIESFDPFIVGWFKKNAKAVVRGQLAMNRKRYYPVVKNVLAFMAGNLLLNFLGRPHFAAYSHEDRCFNLSVVKLLGGLRISWTVKDQETHDRLIKKSDGIIFEGYSPDSRW
jgi:glycerophosphoryl diester phosphodiesterase